MMLDPARWPCWPFLPIKNPKVMDGSFPKIGCMFDSPNKEVRTTVYLTSIYEQITREIKKEVYKSVDEILEAGWLVD